MNYPNKINVLGTDIKIRFFGDDEYKELDFRLGQWCSTTKTISIYEKLPPTSMADTFLHELLHCIAWMISFNRQINNSKDTQDLQEILVSHLSSAIQSSLRSNPGVLEWYLGLIRDIPFDPGMPKI